LNKNVYSNFAYLVESGIDETYPVDSKFLQQLVKEIMVGENPLETELETSTEEFGNILRRELI